MEDINEKVKQATCPICGHKARSVVLYQNLKTGRVVGCNYCVELIPFMKEEDMPRHSDCLDFQKRYEELKDKAFPIGSVIFIGDGKNPNEELKGTWSCLGDFGAWRRSE